MNLTEKIKSEIGSFALYHLQYVIEEAYQRLSNQACPTAVVQSEPMYHFHVHHNFSNIHRALTIHFFS
jgi:hypothetical protein